MTPDELAQALDQLPEDQLLGHFSSALARRGQSPEPAADDGAPEMTADDWDYIALFGGLDEVPPPMSPDDAANYARLFPDDPV